jgi:hypothetical protein
MAKAPIEIRSLARSHTASAIKTLAGIMNEKKAPAAARVSAAQALLDRGWGKAPQPLDGDGEGGPINVITEIRRTIVRKDS